MILPMTFQSMVKTHILAFFCFLFFVFLNVTLFSRVCVCGRVDEHWASLKFEQMIIHALYHLNRVPSPLYDLNGRFPASPLALKWKERFPRICALTTGPNLTGYLYDEKIVERAKSPRASRNQDKRMSEEKIDPMSIAAHDEIGWEEMESDYAISLLAFGSIG